MKIHFDTEADALYLRLNDAPIEESEEIYPGVVLDFNAENKVVAIEVLNVKSQLPDADLTKFVYEVA
jgi:uncharacterized protein YuzE